MITRILVSIAIGLFSCSAFAGDFVSDELLMADNNRKERRDDRQDDRDDKQDCRQEEGRVGDDKRECKQEERGEDDDGEKEDEENGADA